VRTAFLLPLILGAQRMAHTGVCSDTLGHYQAAGYFVSDVKIRTGPDLIKPALSVVAPGDLRLQPRVLDAGGRIARAGLFDTVSLSLDTRTLANRFRNEYDRFGFVLVTPSVEGCDDANHSLQVVYHLLSFRMPGEAGSIVRSLSPANSRRILDMVFPRLLASYDRSHRVYGGINTALQAAPGGIFDRVRLSAAGSSAGSSTEMSFTGARDLAHAAVQHVEWGAGYSYFDEPSDVFAWKRSTLFARGGAYTAPRGASALVWHFGAAVEGGHEQTNPAAGNSVYGAIKPYVAIEANPQRNYLSFSYGLQLGKSSPGAAVDYTKHIFDSFYARQWFPGEDHHRAISLEARLTAGISTGSLPVPERFFGGNGERAFIADDSWEIRAGPFLRSFPANRFHQAGAAFDGENFVSANMTVAYPIYHRPLLPREIRGDGEFRQILDGALRSSTKLLENLHEKDAPAFVAFRKEVLGFEGPLQELRAWLAAIRSHPALPGSAIPDIDSALTDLDSVDENFQQMRDPELPDPTAPVVTVAVGFPGVPALLVTVAEGLEAIEAALPSSMNAQQADLRVREASLRQAVEDPIGGFVVRYPKLDLSVATREAEADMKLPTTVLDRFLNELNLLSASPALMLDTARLGPHAEGGGFRYGIGPALRFSLVNLNVTLGYSFNAGRRPGEKGGAFTMALSLGDLFR